MKASWSSASSAQSHSFLITLTLLIAIGVSTGCSTSSPPAETGLAGNTNVTVLLSSTANDQVTSFDLSLKTLTLTSRTGKTVTLVSSQQPAEFMHLNGGIEPLMTVSLPQDVYTSATATLDAAHVYSEYQVLRYIGAELGVYVVARSCAAHGGEQYTCAFRRFRGADSESRIIPLSIKGRR